MNNITNPIKNLDVKAIEELGYLDSIVRRVVTSEEVEDKAIWVRPDINKTAEEEIASFRTTRGIVDEEEIQSIVSMEIEKISFDTFFSTVLVTAKRLYIDTTSEDRGVNWGAFMGAGNKDCKDILTWATDEKPSQYSWAMNPTLVPTKGLLFGKGKLEVTRLFDLPCQWNDSNFNEMDGLIFHVPEWNDYLIENNYIPLVSNSLFTEIIKPELYEHRDAIQVINDEQQVEVTESSMFFTGLENFTQLPIMIVDDGTVIKRYSLFK
jgi:hypothetical protein